MNFNAIQNPIILGSTGTLGRALKNVLSGKNLSVSDTFEEEFKRNYRIENKTQIDYNLLKKQKPTSIIYTAQSRRYKEYPAGVADLTMLNITIPLQLSEICADINIPFVYCSTGSIYKNSTNRIDENSELIENHELNPYTASKLLTDLTLQEKLSSQKIIILRPFYIYGIGARVPALFPTLVDKIKRNETIHLSGAEGMLINPIHSIDAARAIIHLLEKNLNGVYNLAGLEIFSMRQISKIIGYEVGTKPEFSEMQGPLKTIANQDKLIGTGFKYESKFEESLKLYISAM